MKPVITIVLPPGVCTVCGRPFASTPPPLEAVREHYADKHPDPKAQSGHVGNCFRKDYAAAAARLARAEEVTR